MYFQGRTSSHLFQLHYWLTWKYAATFGTMLPPSQYKCSIWLSAHWGKFDVQPYQPTTSTLCDLCVAIIQFYNLAFQPSSSKWLRVFSSVGTREKSGSSDTVCFWGVWFFHLWLNVLLLVQTYSEWEQAFAQLGKSRLATKVLTIHGCATPTPTLQK